MGQVGSNLSVYNTAGPYSDGDTSYITAAWDRDDVYAKRVPQKMLVGDDEVYVVSVRGTDREYRNVRLRSNTQYSFFIRYDIEKESNKNDVSLHAIATGAHCNTL